MTDEEIIMLMAEFIHHSMDPINYKRSSLMESEKEFCTAEQLNEVRKYVEKIRKVGWSLEDFKNQVPCILHYREPNPLRAPSESIGALIHS